MGLLRKLRDVGGLKPWGAIVYGKATGKWGMAWGERTRAAAVASARSSCGDCEPCPVEISFFGTACGVFAYSGASWAITARENRQGQGRGACGLRQARQGVPRSWRRSAPTAPSVSARPSEWR